MSVKVFLGADHRGFKIKEELKKWLPSEGYQVVDMGNTEYDPEDDFVDFASKVAEMVSQGKGVGILACGSGGMAIVANKFKGVRAVEVYNEERARHAKADDNANVLTIPADVLEVEKAKEVVRAWMEAVQRTEEKYLRRLKKIEEIEDRLFKDA